MEAPSLNSMGMKWGPSELESRWTAGRRDIGLLSAKNLLICWWSWRNENESGIKTLAQKYGSGKHSKVIRRSNGVSIGGDLHGTVEKKSGCSKSELCTIFKLPESYPSPSSTKKVPPLAGDYAWPSRTQLSNKSNNLSARLSRSHYYISKPD